MGNSWHSQDRPHLHTEATTTSHSHTASTETHPQGFTQAHDTSVHQVALDIQKEQPHYCTHGLHM